MTEQAITVSCVRRAATRLNLARPSVWPVLREPPPLLQAPPLKTALVGLCVCVCVCVCVFVCMHVCVHLCVCEGCLHTCVCVWRKQVCIRWGGVGGGVERECMIVSEYMHVCAFIGV